MAATDLIELFLNALVERGCTESTLEGYAKNLTRADRQLPYGLDVATAEELRAWIHRTDLAPASRAVYYAAIDSFFRWAVDCGRIDFSPLEHVRRPKVPEGLPRAASDEQARWAIHETPEPLKLWAILACYAGLRCIEISRLRREHVTEISLSVHKGKGNRARIVPTHRLVWSAIKDHDVGPITDLTAKQISTRFLQFALRCKRRDLSLHRLRGWMATRAYIETKDPRAIQVILGHSRLTTTTRYIGTDFSQQQATIAALP